MEFKFVWFKITRTQFLIYTKCGIPGRHLGRILGAKQESSARVARGKGNDPSEGESFRDIAGEGSCGDLARRVPSKRIFLYLNLKAGTNNANCFLFRFFLSFSSLFSSFLSVWGNRLYIRSAFALIPDNLDNIHARWNAYSKYLDLIEAG